MSMPHLSSASSSSSSSSMLSASSYLGTLDGVMAIRHYIDRMLNDSKSQGMKAFLLDASTTQIVSAVYSQTEILNKQVYLVTRLDDDSTTGTMDQDGASSSGTKMGHLKAVIFCRPTLSNLECLGRHLSNPRYQEYHVFFSSILNGGLLRMLAEQDVHERIQQVQEYYADFVPLNPDLWTLQTRHSLAMTTAAGTSWAPKYAFQYERNLQGLQSMLLALKRQPSCIRYAAQSPCAEELAKDLYDTITADDIFTFRRSKTSGGLLVLVLDRRDDPVTPLLSQWTYQAMVHELLGLNNHRVVLEGAPNIAKDLEQVVLNQQQDAFFAKNCHKNFGQLGEAIQKLLQDYQKVAADTKNKLNSIEDIQAFMEQFPELRSQSHVVSKHVAIMGELARLVEQCHLMDVSQLEQELACNDDHNNHWRMLMEKLASPLIKVPDKLRLGLLYALRYETLGNLHMLQSLMTKHGVPADLVQQLLPTLLRYGGAKSRGPGLYGSAEQNSVMSKMTKSFMTSVQGIENVYAQHVPVLMDLLSQVCRGKLSTRTHPVVTGSLAPFGFPSGGSGSGSSNSSGGELPIPDEILVFMVGGVTYEEGTKVHEFNTSNTYMTQNNTTKIKVVLGGSTVHNSSSFLDELKATAI